MASIFVSTPYNREFIMVLSSDHVSPAPGKSPSVTISKAGGVLAAAQGVVSEIGSGRYVIAYTSIDTNTLGDLGLEATAGGCDITSLTDQIIPPTTQAQQAGQPRPVSNSPIVGRVISRSDVPLFARLRDPSSFALLTQAAISTITYNVENLTTQLSVGTGTLTIASVVFNALQQNDPAWTVDSSGALGQDGTWGYNFKTTIPGANFTYTPTVDAFGNPQSQKFQVDVFFTLVNTGVFRVPFQFPGVPVFA